MTLSLHKKVMKEKVVGCIVVFLIAWSGFLTVSLYDIFISESDSVSVSCSHSLKAT